MASCIKQEKSHSQLPVSITGRSPVTVSVYGEELSCIPPDGITVQLIPTTNDGCTNKVCAPIDGSTSKRCQFKCPLEKEAKLLVLGTANLTNEITVCEITFDLN